MERLKHLLFREFSGDNISFETYFVSGSGKAFPVNVSFSRIKVKDVKSIICIPRDISEQRKRRRPQKTIIKI